ncbi:MAG: adenylyltransferase/cytidyltransferase family protein [Alphaproteobacteria bacterium]|nr:adenylyltransferase/cytidyltransferase family protein [Alphaproteobacteria bacterium]
MGDNLNSAESKIKALDELAVIAETARAKGIRVALCHGVFDLVHLGHLRHLKSARGEGDMLIVTISGDHMVNKGPGRPVFNEQFRAEMLAGFDVVDFVGISHHPGAEYVIELIKPSVYVKGAEYQNAEKDVTGRIVTEQMMVERYGGHIAFTHDLTFSSSSLLNRHFDIYPRQAQEYLSSYHDTDMLDRVLGAIESIRNCKVVFVGDKIIDESQYVEPLGKPSKENIIATRHIESEIFCGGVIAAANLVADFVAEVEIVTVLGSQDSQEELIRTNLRPNVHLKPFYRDDAPTTLKRRMVDPTYTRKLFEISFINDRPMEEDIQAEVDAYLADRLPTADVVIVADFGHGAIAESTVPILCSRSPFLALNAQTNSANHGYNLITKYPRADYVCIDAPEARLAMSDRRRALDVLIKDGLLKKIDCQRLMVTHGKNGCIAFDRENGTYWAPAFTSTVVDTMGAGDAFLAITSPMVAKGVSLEVVAFIGNAVGAMKVKVVGHRSSIDRAGLTKYVTALLK